MNMYGERKAGKPVYKDFADAEHTAVAAFAPPAGLPVIIGLDQWLTPGCGTYVPSCGTELFASLMKYLQKIAQ